VISACCNPECGVPFVCGRGRFFRFHKNRRAGEPAPNTHSVQHFWLCERCCRQFTLELRDGAGVLIKNRSDLDWPEEFSRVIAAV
jgi:hypothetical protein